MRETRAASRYAKALLDLALEQGLLEQVYADMQMIKKTCEESRELSLFLKSPILKTDKKIEVLRALFQSKISKLSISFIDIIARKRRESYLEGITSEFLNQYKRHKKILTAVVTTASGLDDTLRTKIHELIKSTHSNEVELVEQEDKDIIGGFVLRVGDKQVDASILKQLNSLKREFSENPFIREY